MGNTLFFSKHTISANTSKQDEDEENLPTFTCEICLEQLSSENRFKHNSPKCTNHHFCCNCIGKYIQTKVLYSIFSDIKCPAQNCSVLLDPLSCAPLLSPALFDKWCFLLCESAILRSKHVYCPYPECSALILNECRKTAKKSECPDCKRLFCFRCKCLWHAGYTCNGSKERKSENDFLFRNLMRKNKWQRCPKCRQCVEHVLGCHHIVCRCGENFCYACGEKSKSHSIVCTEESLMQKIRQLLRLRDRL